MRRALGLSLLLLAFFAMRLPSLRLLPLYSDEGIGIWRAERVLEGSLTRGSGEGKPLHAWWIAAAIALPGDDILGARAAHVVTGAVLLLALWDLTRRRVSTAAGWIAAALWIVLPFGAIFERTVTPDVPLAAATVAVAACAFRVAAPDRPESRRWRWLLLLAGGAAMFFKMPVGVLGASLPLLIPLALPAEERAAARARLRTYTIALVTTIVVLAAIVAVRGAIGIRPIGFGFHEFERKVTVIRDAETAPSVLVANLQHAGEFARLYLGPIGIALLLAGLVGAWGARQRTVTVLSAFSLAWTALFVANARSLSAHYLLAAVPFYVMAMAWAVAAGARVLQRRGERPLVTGAVAAAAVALALVTSWPLHRALWTDPISAPFARPERTQYLEGKWSGYGLPEAAAWLDEAAAKGGSGPLFVAIHIADYQRLLLYAGEAARENLMQIQVDRYTVRVPQMIERLEALLESGRRVLVIVGSDVRFHGRWRSAFPAASPRAGFEKPGGESSAVVIELVPRAVSSSRGIFGQG